MSPFLPPASLQIRSILRIGIKDNMPFCMKGVKKGNYLRFYDDLTPGITRKADLFGCSVGAVRKRSANFCLQLPVSLYKGG